MSEVTTQPLTGTTPATLTAREKRDLQRAQLRPLANLRPELYDEDDYSPDELPGVLTSLGAHLTDAEVARLRDVVEGLRSARVG